MDEATSGERISPKEVGEVLANLASLMEDFRRSDEAIQTALSSLTNRSETQPTLFELQHVDLLTQSHFDISKLLRCLSEWAQGRPISRADLRSTLTLRSLQDRLIDTQSNHLTAEAGELSLF